MAILSADKTYVTVESGDTLSQIAEKYADGASKAQWLADINGISNPNVIHPGQKIMLSKTVSYFAKYTGSSGSIVTALSSLGEKSSYSYRCEIAKLNGITPYSGTAAQNIKMLNLLKQGKLIKAGTASATSSGTSKTVNTNAVVWQHIGLVSGSNNQLYATWTWSNEKNTASYSIVWEYCMENGVWLVGENKTNTVDENYPAAARQSTYTFPDNATQVRIKVKPIAKTESQKSGSTTKEVAKFTADWSDWYYFYEKILPPDVPPIPTVEIDKYELTAVIENLDAEELDATSITFQIVKIVKNDTSTVETKTVAINTTYNRVSYTRTIEAGNEYKVRCKAVKGTMESDWSDFSAVEQAMPSAPSEITTCKASGKETDGYKVYLEWSSVHSADTYDIEYTTNKDYFDNAGGDVTPISTTDDSTKLTIFGLAGGEYYFRIRAVNEKGTSDWCEPNSVKIGEPPAAPTTWESTTTVIVGESLTLYWVHNSEDNSSQTWAQLELDVSGVKTVYEIENNAYYGINASGIKYKVKDFEDDAEKDVTKYCIIDTSGFGEGAKLTWRARTMGIINEFGDWSTPREIDVYAPPNVDLMVTDSFEIDEDGNITPIEPEGGVMSTLGAFPFYVKAVAGPTTQTPIGYHLSIVANYDYETVDSVGNVKMVSSGEQVYSKYFDISVPLLVEFSAGNVDLENGIEYTINCTVSMNSGLTASTSSVFTVSWSDMQYIPNAEISIDPGIFTASIRPYCEERYTVLCKVVKEGKEYSTAEEELIAMTLDRQYTTTGEKVFIGVDSRGNEIYYCVSYTSASGVPTDPTYYRVNHNSGIYTITSTKVNRSTLKPVRTTTGEEVLLGVIEDGTAVYYCEAEKASMVDGVTLAVYRREFDGSFTEIAKGIDNTKNTYVTDPHPALDYARYRIVATTDSTGAVSYYDLPGVPVGGKAVIMQWEETWSSFDEWTENALSQPIWSGSMLSIPYNIDVADSNSADVTHVKYIGRKRPVAYYGTQLGETSTWNVSIPKEDKETLYSLRRLAVWMGNVYVREPSGTGYWAQVSVSFTQTHLEVTIPVTFNITRVEGGI